MDTSGFFGKLPSNGDFVSRRLPREFLDLWDHWLQRCIAESKASLGDDWLNAYLTSPIWRFAIAKEVCGDEAIHGVLMPSVDKVGRYFPLSIIAPSPANVSPLSVARGRTAWFDEAEALLLNALKEDAPAFDAFDTAVGQLATGDDNVGPEEFVTPPHSETGRKIWQLALSDAASAGDAVGFLSAAIVSEQIGPYSIWWTADGGGAVTTIMAAQFLPDPSHYTDMLSAGTQSADHIPTDWQDVEPEESESSHIDTINLDPGSLGDLINTPARLAFTSASATNAGKTRRENEDGFLDKSSDGVWLVADGMGGHAGGKTASAAIVAAVDDMELPADLDGRIQAVTHSLQLVNQELLNHAARRPESSGLGSTVAVLLVANGASAVVWAGDTRVYRKRGQSLEKLTLDHSEHQELLERGDIASILGPTNVVTRAVGGDETLQVSTVRQSIQPGDRFLLCSDGVYDEVPLHELAILLEEGDCRKACDAIINSVLEGRAPDNATAVVVDAVAG